MVTHGCEEIRIGSTDDDDENLDCASEFPIFVINIVFTYEIEF